MVTATLLHIGVVVPMMTVPAPPLPPLIGGEYDRRSYLYATPSSLVAMLLLSTGGAASLITSSTHQTSTAVNMIRRIELLQ